MAPIPLYTNSPITAAKPDGVTPKTDAPGRPDGASSSPTSTYTPSTYTTAAQPGAASSLPAPTGPPTAAQPYHSHLLPTPTTSIGSSGPAPPQPGSVPVSSLPPPPKAGERYQPPTQTPAPVPAPPTATMPIPRQMGIPAPSAPQPSQQRGTYTIPPMASSSHYGAPVPSALTGIGAGVGGENTSSLSHPPGYQQNANTSDEFGRYQRSPMEQREADDSGDGLWGAAKKLAWQTGEKLAAAESEVWKKINKD
ncbi:hypothetical protein F5Y14DRAFT_87420 [Nemania sp. NC0429]|nr:hypothetical protein F5Y14DRAFT_87420 [Nemania sp. NC0429]